MPRSLDRSHILHIPSANFSPFILIASIFIFNGNVIMYRWVSFAVIYQMSLAQLSIIEHSPFTLEVKV